MHSRSSDSGVAGHGRQSRKGVAIQKIEQDRKETGYSKQDLSRAARAILAMSRARGTRRSERRGVVRVMDINTSRFNNERWFTLAAASVRHRLASTIFLSGLPTDH